jgi:DNA-damage-inducible protein J
MNDVVRARIDPRLKKSASAVLRKIGLTPSDAFRLLMTRIAAEEKLPFDPLIPNKKTVAAVKEARRGKLKSVKRVEDL